jgi:hypothetical protein
VKGKLESFMQDGTIVIKLCDVQGFDLIVREWRWSYIGIKIVKAVVISIDNAPLAWWI